MNVYSAFDGCSGGQQALERLGFTFDGVNNTYYSSEIDKYAQAVTAVQYANTKFLGDIHGVDATKLPHINLMICGSPCQDLSFAGLGKGFSEEGKRSNLFWVWLKQFKIIKPDYVLVENVKMKTQWSDMMSEALGFGFKELNSKYISAQNRVRLYWFGKRVGDTYEQVPIQDLPDLGIMLKDVLDDGYVDRDKSYCIDANYWKGGNLNQYFNKSRRQLVFNKCLEVGHTAEIKGYDIIKRVYSPEGKAPTLTTMQGGHREPKVATTDPKGGRIVNRRKLDGVRKDNDKSIPLEPYLEVREDDKTNCLSTVQKDNVVVSKIRDKSKTVRVGGRGSYDRHEWDSVDELHWRKLSVRECEKLQTIRPDYTSLGLFEDGNVKKISNSQRYKMLGNGFSIDTISWILQGMKDV